MQHGILIKVDEQRMRERRSSQLQPAAICDKLGRKAWIDLKRDESRL